jgi:hypothetical protein
MSLFNTTKLMFVIPPLEEWLRDYAERIPWDIHVQAGARTAMQVNAAYLKGASNATHLWETPHGPRVWHSMVVASAVDILVGLSGIIMENDCKEYVHMDKDAREHGFVTGRDWKTHKGAALGDFGHIEYAGWRILPYAGHWPDDSHLDFSDVLAGTSSCSSCDV